MFLTKKVAAKLIGNWGVAFFGPLVGNNAAEAIYDVGLEFHQSIIVSFFSSLLVLGLFVSRELEKYALQK